MELMDSLYIVFLSLQVVSLTLVHSSQIGYFWQVTDFHYDANYSIYGKPTEMCHNTTSGSFNNSAFGNYLCDAPLKLVESATSAMKKINANPDFILWTGDSVPHVKSNTMNLEKVLSNIGIMSGHLRQTFPNVTIYPVLGNHDEYPEDAFPWTLTVYYPMVLTYGGFNSMLNNQTAEQFIKGGYYSEVIGQTKLKIIGLNTNLYYGMDPLITEKITDPAGQFEWLENELSQSRKANQKVILLTHVPPGLFELYSGLMWFRNSYNQRYIEILRKYHDVISSQIYGHEHTDSFRILNDHQGNPLSILYLGPAVTPWKSTLKGVGSNNPSVRLYEYDRNTGQILDFHQYYLDLQRTWNTGRDDWQLEYSALQDYGLPNLNPKTMQKLVNSFLTNDTFFDKYLVYNSVSANSVVNCSMTCRLLHFCSITQLERQYFDECMKGFQTTLMPSTTTNHPRKHVQRYYVYIIAGLGGLVFILFIVVAILCFRKRKHFIPHRYSRFAGIGAGPIN